MAKISVTLDQDIPSIGLSAGEVITFDSEIKTTDDGLAFYISQLAQLEPRIYETKYPNINFQELIPLNTSVPEWVDNVDYISYDGVTMGKFIGANADDLPNVAAKAKKDSVPVGYAGNKFEYSLDELRKSQHMNMPLDITLAILARRGAEEHMQRVAYFGDADRKMDGLFNHQNVATTNDSLDWGDGGTSGKDILDSLNAMMTEVWELSKGVHVPNTVVLSANRWAYLASTAISDLLPNQTLLQTFQTNNLYTRMTGQQALIVPRFQLEHAGGSNDKDRIMVYERNPENLVMYVPMFWRPTAPQPHNLKIAVPAEYKCSGTEFRYPFSAMYFDLDVDLPAGS